MKPVTNRVRRGMRSVRAKDDPSRNEIQVEQSEPTNVLPEILECSVLLFVELVEVVVEFIP